jgi:hypothetical protein
MKVRHIRHNYYINENLVPHIIDDTITSLLNVLETSHHAVEIWHKMRLINITCDRWGVKISRLIAGFPRPMLAGQSWV